MDCLLELHQSELFAYLVKMLRSDHDAEDALQQALLQAVKQLRWLQEPKYFGAWLFRIASRIAFQLIRQKNRGKNFQMRHLLMEYRALKLRIRKQSI